MNKSTLFDWTVKHFHSRLSSNNKAIEERLNDLIEKTNGVLTGGYDVGRKSLVRDASPQFWEAVNDVNIEDKELLKNIKNSPEIINSPQEGNTLLLQNPILVRLALEEIKERAVQVKAKIEALEPLKYEWKTDETFWVSEFLPRVADIAENIFNRYTPNAERLPISHKADYFLAMQNTAKSAKWYHNAFVCTNFNNCGQEEVLDKIIVFCQAEIEKYSTTVILPQTPLKVGSGFSKTDLIRLVDALYGIKFINDEKGQIPDKKKVMEIFGDLFGVNMKDYESNLSQSYNETSLEANRKMLERMLKYVENECNKRL